MALLQSLGKLIGRAGNTVNNDVVDPLGRLLGSNRPVAPLAPNEDPPPPDFHYGLSRDPVKATYGSQPAVAPNRRTPVLSQGIMRPQLAIDPRAAPLSQSIFQPMDKETQAVVDSASGIYEFTPAFKSILNAAQPSLGEIGGRGNLKSGLTPAAYYLPGRASNQGNGQRLRLGSGYGRSTKVVAHEGLHAAFNDTPGLSEKFSNAYTSSKNADIEKYLKNRLEGYENYKGSLDWDSVEPDIRSEIHSYLGEYPLDTGNQLPNSLQDYYKQFVNPNNANKNYASRYKVRKSIENALSRTNPYRPSITYVGDE